MNQFSDNEVEGAWIESLVGLVERIVLESGDLPGFDARAWTLEWLATECAALAGKTPNDFRSTPGGRDVVTRLVMQMQSGAYA